MPLFRLEMRTTEAREYGADVQAVLSQLLALHSADETKRLYDRLPLKCTLNLPSERASETIRQRLQKVGIQAHFESVRQASRTCHKHRLVAIETPCPRCKKPRLCPVCEASLDTPLCEKCEKKSQRRSWFRTWRIAILLFILVAVALASFTRQRALRSWKRPLSVAIYPVLAEADEDTADFVKQLTPQDMSEIERFLIREAERYGRDLSGVMYLRLGSPIRELPPDRPEPGSSALSIMVWSLQLRYWAWRTQSKYKLPSAKARIFVLYHSFEKRVALDQSFGIQNMQLGLVQTAAGEAMAPWTRLAIAHEFLHLFGATDKYDPSGVPLAPEGLAEPDKNPRYPQRSCEIMAGLIAESERRARPAHSLDECQIGPATAREINWLSE